jgi:hypothetical protein
MRILLDFFGLSVNTSLQIHIPRQSAGAPINDSPLSSADLNAPDETVDVGHVDNGGCGECRVVAEVQAEIIDTANVELDGRDVAVSERFGGGLKVWDGGTCW